VRILEERPDKSIRSRHLGRLLERPDRPHTASKIRVRGGKPEDGLMVPEATEEHRPPLYPPECHQSGRQRREPAPICTDGLYRGPVL
jgi:hypothetical protein